MGGYFNKSIFPSFDVLCCGWSSGSSSHGSSDSSHSAYIPHKNAPLISPSSSISPRVLKKTFSSMDNIEIEEVVDVEVIDFDEKVTYKAALDWKSGELLKKSSIHNLDEDTGLHDESSGHTTVCTSINSEINESSEHDHRVMAQREEINKRMKYYEEVLGIEPISPIKTSAITKQPAVVTPQTSRDEFEEEQEEQESNYLLSKPLRKHRNPVTITTTSNPLHNSS